MSYDANGSLLQATDARGSTVSYTYDALDRKTGEYAATTASQSASNQLASWVYDNSNNVAGVTDPVGQLTTATTYSGGAAYVIQQKGFNKFGESLGETVTIPAAAGALAGTYTFGHTYTSLTGLPYSDTYPAAGGLPAETVIHNYESNLDLPKGLGGSIDPYAQNTSYDAYGDVITEIIGNTVASTHQATITNTYDPHTLRLTDSLATRAAATPAAVDDEQYTYDLSGNITRQVSTRLGSSATSETQCFAYDALARLTAAWTATDGCAATPTSSSHSTVGDGLGAASEYWTSYSYDLLGDMTSQVQHNSVTGGTDTTTTNTYNGNGAGQPHTLTTSAQTGGTTATSAFGYDKTGNMTTRDVPATGNQTLTWNAAEKLTTVTATAGTTSYTYDADGNLLLQQDPGSTTLYLPGEQLTATGSTVTGARIIPLPSGGDVVRTGATTSYSFEIPDIRGTTTLYLDNTAQTPTWRQFTPYGAPRGPATTWIDNRAFLNKPNDPVTGLTSLGARQYDPVTGQFISPDPILIPTNPQDLNPYAYAADNPVTNTDPTGLCANTADALCPGQTRQATQAAATQQGTYNRHNINSYYESIILFDYPSLQQQLKRVYSRPWQRSNTKITLPPAFSNTPIFRSPTVILDPLPPDFGGTIVDPLPPDFGGTTVDPIPPDFGGTIFDPPAPDLGQGNETYPILGPQQTVTYNSSNSSKTWQRRVAQAFLILLLLQHNIQQDINGDTLTSSRPPAYEVQVEDPTPEELKQLTGSGSNPDPGPPAVPSGS